MLITKKLKKNFKYRDLGGKLFTIEFEVPKEEVLWKGVMEGNWACRNFIERRNDFDHEFSNKLYYGKIDGLGYIISEDELEG